MEEKEGKLVGRTVVMVEEEIVEDKEAVKKVEDTREVATVV